MIFRENSLLKSFSYWGDPTGRDPTHIYDLRRYVLKPGQMIEWANNWVKGTVMVLYWYWSRYHVPSRGEPGRGRMVHSSGQSVHCVPLVGVRIDGAQEGGARGDLVQGGLGSDGRVYWSVLQYHYITPELDDYSTPYPQDEVADHAAHVLLATQMKMEKENFVEKI